MRKRYALLQTPEFVEEFILDQTLEPAIVEFGLRDVTLIDPTCGSGHFLLGAFGRLFRGWQQKEPTEHVADLARRALDQVYGVDINPYAVAIARFRLVIAVLDAVAIKRLERAPDIKPNIVAADSLLHRFDARADSTGQMSLGDDLQWGEKIFRLENRAEVERVLTKRFHVVVGNPPYIVEKDSAKKKKYRDQYQAATFEVPLAPPFVERFFQLAVEGGQVGAIVSNAFTKRDSGKALIEEVLPKLDVREIVDTSGCYLPGHGTPTLLIFGRNRPPAPESSVISVLGKRGEQDVPAEPSAAPVWTEIVENHRTVGWDGTHVSVEESSRAQMRTHPWVLAGGGARVFFQRIRTHSAKKLVEMSKVMGAGAVTRADDVFILAMRSLLMPARSIARYVTGTHVRVWEIASHLRIAYPYEGTETVNVEQLGEFYRLVWCYRPALWLRRGKGFKTKLEQGGRFYEYSMFYPDRHAAPYRLTYPYVSTHNHFVLSDAGSVFNKHAPLIILKNDFGKADYQALLGYLNSSTVAFWCRLVMVPKGGDQVGDGARLSATQWNRHLEYAGNLLKQLPVPKLEELREKLLDLVVAAEEIVAKMSVLAPENVVEATLSATPNLVALRDARTKSLAERARLRALLVSFQEEMDWRVYGLFGMPTVEAPTVDAVRVPVEPSHRPFEVRLAREGATDISASEWFRLHKREAPNGLGGPLADLYRQRLRLLDDAEHGKQLRLLETPETKRRWSSPDEAKAFSDAVRTWLLVRIEALFREQTMPELRTARQLALDIGREPAVGAAHELLTEESGHDLVTLISALVDREGVPFLAGYRYAEPGMEKRATWEETWRLQRLEDDGELAPELTRLNLKAIPVPDKYGPKDFLRHFWSLRGKLDVPKERFITVPGGNTDEDSTPLVGWAGWNHLQVAQALSGLYQRRRTEWPKERLHPLLAGIDERVPWLIQWHNDFDPTYGTKPGDFFRDFVAEAAHALGVAVSELRTWRPPSAAKRVAIDPAEVLAALQIWKPDIEEYQADDDDEEVELPEGPTDVELATEVGATKVLVAKALKKLIADGLVEKISGRPARYVAIGDQA